MKPHHSLIALGALVALTACETLEGGFAAPDITLDDEPFIEAIYLEAAVVDPETAPALMPAVARTYGPAVTPLENETQPSPPAIKPHIAIDRANDAAAIEPRAENYMNAIQIYPYKRGALYQVYTAPEQVTDIALEPGEELMSVSAGDTARWILGDTVSGAGDTAQVHILVKPIQPGLKTNLIVTTTRRAYYIELQAFRETYMAAVSWRYPDAPLVKQAVRQARPESRARGPKGLQLDRLNFRYEVTGDTPHWRPERVFDDGRKVYIQFPARLDQGEAPPLFVVGRDGKSQLVNYRMRSNYYVVDRMFALAELRLGEKRQEVVRIARTDLKVAAR